MNELNQRREQIARYDRATLDLFTIANLRKLAVNIVPGHAKMKKEELIDAMITATKAEKLLLTVIPDMSIETIEENLKKVKDFAENVDADLGTWAKNYYQDFRNVVQANCKDEVWKPEIYGDISTLAYRVIRFLDDHEGCQENGKLAFTTKLSYRTHICNLISEMIDSESSSPYYKQLEACREILFKQISFQIKDTSNQKAGLQERRIAERKLEKVEIDFKPIYEFAETSLLNLDSLKVSEWKKVSISLAIVTGRRLAEIHLSSTLFEYVDDNHVNFTGQLKTKGDAEVYFDINPSYKIPVLIDSKLVCKAHEWLKENGKVVDTPKAAATRYSVDLSETMKILRKKLGITHSFFTYKGLRTVYAQVCDTLYNPDKKDNMLYLAQILGHGRGELLRGDNLIDTATPQSYNSDFNVVNMVCVISKKKVEIVETTADSDSYEGLKRWSQNSDGSWEDDNWNTTTAAEAYGY